MSTNIDSAQSFKKLADVNFSNNFWRNKHLRSIKNAYSSSPYYTEMERLVFPLIDNQISSLSAFNINFIKKVASQLNIKTQFFLSSEFNISASRSQKLIDICKALDCNEYVSTTGSLGYLREDNFDVQRDVLLKIIKYKVVFYPQHKVNNFISYMSIIDALANNGLSQVRHLIGEYSAID